MKIDENWWKFFTDVHLRVTTDWTLVFEDQGLILSILSVNYGLCTKLQMLLWLSQAPMVSPAPAFGRWPLNRHQSNILPAPCWDQKRHPILAKSTNLETAALNILWYTHNMNHCIITLYIYVYCIHEMLGMHQPWIMSLYIYIHNIYIYIYNIHSCIL